MKPQSSHKKPTSFIVNITATLMALAAITVITACSPKPSAEETATQTKAMVAQAVEETKKEMIAEQAAEKAKQEEKIKQDEAIAQAVATAKKEFAAEQRAAAARTRSHQSSSAPKKIVCTNCGVVLSVKAIETAGKGSGLGVVAGGAVGGLLGNQFGKGSGRDAATIVGVVGGAIAGNQIEKSAKKTKSYDITVKMETGEQRIVHQTTVPDVVSGDAIKIENNVIVKQ